MRFIWLRSILALIIVSTILTYAIYVVSQQLEWPWWIGLTLRSFISFNTGTAIARVWDAEKQRRRERRAAEVWDGGEEHGI